MAHIGCCRCTEPHEAMVKIGRNAPCPCGSGKKYKMCCLGKNALPTAPPAMAAMPLTPSAASDADAPSGRSPLSPYTLAKVFENSERYKRMKRHQPKRAARYCTPRAMARLSTEELLARFAKLDVDASHEAYLRCAEGQHCAWAIGQQWRAAIERSLSRYEEDFVGLGACELWKRYRPERPSIEMLDDWMEAGYDRLSHHDAVGACARWSRVWAHLKPRLGPEMRTVDATDAVFNGVEPLYNWIQDFALELHNAAVNDRGHAEQGRQLCETVLAQFPDEDEHFRINFSADLGEFLYMLGEEEAGGADHAGAHPRPS